jgi:hypothetical protein
MKNYHLWQLFIPAIADWDSDRYGLQMTENHVPPGDGWTLLATGLAALNHPDWVEAEKEYYALEEQQIRDELHLSGDADFDWATM